MVSAFAFILIKFKCQRKWYPNEVEAVKIPPKLLKISGIGYYANKIVRPVISNKIQNMKITCSTQTKKIYL